MLENEGIVGGGGLGCTIRVADSVLAIRLGGRSPSKLEWRAIVGALAEPFSGASEAAGGVQRTSA